MAKYTTEPKAVVLADSISPDGHRLTTMEVTMHRFVLAEFNTHRVFSRNSASSRAIPGSLQRERVVEHPAQPLVWPSKQRGMQGGVPLDGEIQDACASLWESAAGTMADYADVLDSMGVHKSVTNRLLEPFLWHTVIVTSTEWDNFFGLRDNELAQPEIAAAARLMREEYDGSTPRELNYGEWHRPLLPDLEELKFYYLDGGPNMSVDSFLNAVSAARCARVSYLTHEGERDPAKDLELYDRLTSADPPHASPLEHVATPCEGFLTKNRIHKHLGNFTGWDQLRHL